MSDTRRQIGSWLDPTALDSWAELPDAAERAELDPTIETALVALGVAIDEAPTYDFTRTASKRLSTDPARTAFQSMLVQLGAERLMRLLVFLTEPGKPHREALLAALFTPSAGDASAAIRKTVRAVARTALLTRMRADVRLSSLVLCVLDRDRERKALEKWKPVT